MKLENVEKIVKISMEYNKLLEYANALSNIINHFDDDNDMPEEIPTLKYFSAELTRIINSAMDY